MLSIFQVVTILITIGTFTCGTILNSLIVSFYHRTKNIKRNLGVCDGITFTMGCTNLILQWLVTVDETFIAFGLYRQFVKEVYLIFFALFFILIYFWFWLTACLSIYYCLKLVSFSHQFFIQLKCKTSSMVTYLLIVSMLGSCGINIPAVWTVSVNTLGNITDFTALGTTMNLIHLSFSVGFGACLPTVLTSLCLGLTLTSLLKHVNRMKQNSSMFWNPQLKSHRRACRTVFLLMTLNLAFFLTVISLVIKNFDEMLWEIIYWSVIMPSPSVQAVILILGNSQLKRGWVKNFFLRPSQKNIQ
ncbi:hypothetical protein GDO86_017773 [Hymenochirus boettgeri]|uniref:Taste receptor type 2 n=1 Tax=Hymenochirus boettgeri TaxID=247094 RepID=A0A8T2IKW0_9PIPI|nr:hypothetical protein GDO86_017773 [Hymenochirus boettgeri]